MIMSNVNPNVMIGFIAIAACSILYWIYIETRPDKKGYGND